jgi:hypothetical protein
VGNTFGIGLVGSPSIGIEFGETVQFLHAYGIVLLQCLPGALQSNSPLLSVLQVIADQGDTLGIDGAGDPVRVLQVARRGRSVVLFAFPRR